MAKFTTQRSLSAKGYLEFVYDLEKSGTTPVAYITDYYTSTNSPHGSFYYAAVFDTAFTAQGYSVADVKEKLFAHLDHV